MSNQSWFEHFGAFGGFVQITIGDVPTSDFEIDGICHRADLVDGFVDVLEISRFFVELESDVRGGRLGERTVEVRLLDAVACAPLELALIGNNASREG